MRCRGHICMFLHALYRVACIPISIYIYIYVTRSALGVVWFASELYLIAVVRYDCCGFCYKCYTGNQAVWLVNVARP